MFDPGPKLSHRRLQVKHDPAQMVAHAMGIGCVDGRQKPGRTRGWDTRTQWGLYPALWRLWVAAGLGATPPETGRILGKHDLGLVPALPGIISRCCRYIGVNIICLIQGRNYPTVVYGSNMLPRRWLTTRWELGASMCVRNQVETVGGTPQVNGGSTQLCVASGWRRASVPHRPRRGES